MSILNDTTVNGVVTQTEAATQPQHLVRLQEAQQIIVTMLTGNWSSTRAYTAGQLTTDPNGSLYVATGPSVNLQPSLNPAQWNLAVAGGSNGASAFVYIAYASDNAGTGFSLTPGVGLNYIAFAVSATAITSPTSANFSNWRLFIGAAGTAGAAGASSYMYVAYASDASGTGFSLSPSSGLNYIGVLTTTSQVLSLSAANFTGLWSQFIIPGAAGSNGSAGVSSYSYVGYASDNAGTGFSLTPGLGLNYIAFLMSPTVIGTPVASNFVGLWGRYVGATGATGGAGTAGAAGASVFGYVGYASDTSGTGFSLTPSSGLNFVAFLLSPTVIGSPIASNFNGLWKNYANTFTVTTPITFSGGVLALNASSASTASFLVQRDGSGNFAGNVITGTSFVVGTATISMASTSISMNASLVVPGITVTGLSGILLATTGVLSGNATSDNLPEGSTNKYFTTARVLATALTGISSTHVLLATDTILSAMGKIDVILGGSFPGGSVTGNLSISGNLNVSGTTTLASSVNGILMATSGVIAGSATTDNLTVGSTNLYWTQTLFNTAIAAIKNVANGIAPLDSSGKVPLANSYATGATPYGAASQSAMLLLSAAKQGDLALRSDTGITFVLSNNLPGTLSSWVALVYPVLSVNGATGAVSLTADNVPVGTTNLYWTQTLFNTAIAAIKNAVSGICPLDINSLVPAANLPPIGNSIWTANSQGTQTGLTSALKGDLANRTDQNLTYILSNNTPGTFSNWVPLLYPVASVNSLTGTIVLTTTNIAEGSNLYHTAARVLTATLTGFTAGTGTVTSADTVLSAFQKLVANAVGTITTTGGTLTGILNFSGTGNAGIIPSQLSATQVGALSTSAGNYGNIVYDTTNGQLKALVGGSYIVLGAATVCVPLAGGSGSPMTGKLYFTDGLSSFIQFGNAFSCRVSNSDVNLDFLQGGTVVLTCDTSNNVTCPNGFFNTGASGQYKLNSIAVITLSGSQPIFQLGGNFTLTTSGSFAGMVLAYNGTAGITLDQSYNTILEGQLKMSANKVIDQNNFYFDNAGHQILNVQQSPIADDASGASNQTKVNTILASLRAHGLIAT